MSQSLCIAVALLTTFGIASLSTPAAAEAIIAPKQTKTDWQVEPSFTFDTLCFLNILTGDPFYRRYYDSAYSYFEPQLTPAARDALADLKRKIKDDGHGIISAFLTLYFSVTNDRSLDDLIKTVDDSTTMQDRMRKTVYYSDDDWRLYESVRGDLRTIFLFLKEIHFDQYWEEKILPNIRSKIAAIEPDLPRYDVVGEVEARLGSRLPSEKLTVYLLHYSMPHGIRITGLRFLTDDAYPFAIVLRNAIHEPMHPPYHLRQDRELRETLDLLRTDTFIMDKVNHHDPAFGYNSFEGFIEEDCVQAQEQAISEKFGVAVEAHQRWKESDNGMHVFAVALYSAMTAERFDGKKENFRDFLVRNIRSGRLKPGTIQATYEAFYAAATPQ